MFMAEIGTFFNQDIRMAEDMVRRIREIAKSAGTIPVILKGEVLHSAEICLDDDTMETYQSKRGDRKQERYRDLISRKVVNAEDYRKLFTLCRGYGLPVVLSVYDFEGADFAKDVGAVAIKIASSNIVHIPLIRYVGRLGLPVLIDTGRASLAEVDTAVRTARDAGCSQIIIEHSPDGHPAPPENHNMLLLRTYAQTFGVPVGLSDHHNGEEMLYLAIGLGAALLEKNVSFTPDALDQDLAFSMALDELGNVLRRVRNCWVGLGRSYRDPANTKGLISTSSRMGLVAKRPLGAGERLSPENVNFSFPCLGIGVQYFDQVSGWVVRNNIPQGGVIRWTDVVPESS